MTVDRSQILTAPGEGPGIETIVLDSGIEIPTTVVKSLDPDDLPVELRATSDGRARVSSDEAVRFPPRALQYARDVSDQMRVIPGGGSSGVQFLQMWNSNTYAPFNATGGPNSVDARDKIREMSQQSFRQQRARWVFS